jgi:methionine synthase I (cobalamin-dependent)
MALSANVMAYLKHLAAAGDMMAKALIEGSSDLKLSAGAESSDVIKVTGQVTDKAGQVVVKSIPVSGEGTMTDGGAGTIVAGSGSKEVWVQPDATGKFELDVLNAAAENNLIVATTSNGDVSMLVLTFAE